MSALFKPNKGLAKRVRLTRSGKVRRHRVGRGHLLSKKAAHRRRRLRRPALCPSCEARRIKTMLGR